MNSDNPWALGFIKSILVRKLNLMTDTQVIEKIKEAVKYYFSISEEDLLLMPEDVICDAYVYVYLNPLKRGKWHLFDDIYVEYEPIYVGKGTGDRAEYHLITARNTKLHDTIAFIRWKGEEPVIRVFNECCTNEMAYNLENYIIARLRDQGVDVCNATKQRNASKYNKKITPTSLNIEVMSNRLIVDALNATETYKDASGLLGISERSLFRRVKSLKIVKHGSIYSFSGHSVS